MPNLNSNLVVVIPKAPNAERIVDYRPIALANFQFKVITKVIADRLAIIAPKVISIQQRGFIKGRQISDCICTTSEAINMLDYKAFGRNVALKLDIRKSFDTIDWGFLLNVLESFGFNETFCGWIKAILESAKLSISVNGHPPGFFSCKSGVRQGDPLSPLIFCLAEDVLSRGISYLANCGILKPMFGPRNCTTPTHVLYADDIMVFCKGTKRNLAALMSLFHEYGEASGQHLSLGKCKFFVGSMSPARKVQLRNFLGFSYGSIPFTYLGVPIFHGKPKRIHLQPIADRIKNKLSLWKGSLLTIMGIFQLVRSIIHGMLIYSFHIYKWPSSLLKSLDKCLRNFIWSGKPNKRKLVTVAWQKLWSPCNEGDLGLRSLRSINNAALLKLCWEMFSTQNQWAQLLKSRFWRNHSPIRHYAKSSLWPGVREHVNSVIQGSK